jgi:hypothetical protein
VADADKQPPRSFRVCDELDTQHSPDGCHVPDASRSCASVLDPQAYAEPMKLSLARAYLGRLAQAAQRSAVNECTLALAEVDAGALFHQLSNTPEAAVR